jgi:hypothetical protein
VTTGSASALRLRGVIQRARTWMLVGLLWSYFGTTVVGGAVPVLVALGLLPLLWLPLMATLENVQDMCSAAAARMLRRFEAGKILVRCEVADVALTLLAGAAIIAVDQRWAAVILCVYTAATSFLPLFIDLAEEFYGAEIERKAPGSAAVFNTYLYAALPAVSQFVSTPLGSLLAGWSVLAVLAVNVVASLLAVAARYRSLRLGRSVGVGSAANDNESAQHADHEETNITLRTLLGMKGPGSPLFSASVPLAAGLSALYIGQWCASFIDNKGGFFAVAAICAGVGALVGPFLARAATRRFGATVVLYTGCVLTAVLMGSAAVYTWGSDPGSGSIAGLPVVVVLFWAYVALTSSLLTGVEVTQVTARQELFRGDRFIQVMGWGHSFAAAGGLLGVWAGLLLQADQQPAWALAAGAGLLASTILILRPNPNLT